jgi:hypothetical protein
MGKKGLTPEEVAKKVREKGFNDDITGIDNSRSFKPITAHTERLYERRWSMWVEYVSLLYWTSNKIAILTMLLVPFIDI